MVGSGRFSRARSCTAARLAATRASAARIAGSSSSSRSTATCSGSISGSSGVNAGQPGPAAPVSAVTACCARISFSLAFACWNAASAAARCARSRSTWFRSPAFRRCSAMRAKRVINVSCFSLTRTMASAVCQSARVRKRSVARLWRVDCSSAFAATRPASATAARAPRLSAQSMV